MSHFLSSAVSDGPEADSISALPAAAATEQDWVRPLSLLRLTDAALVGYKSAALGEMMGVLGGQGVNVPEGFSTTVQAFEAFLRFNKLDENIRERLGQMDGNDFSALSKSAQKIRHNILSATFPPALEATIRSAYAALVGQDEVSFALRSSATGEDLPSHSSAGQQESFLHVVGIESILSHIKQVFASLYNERAISYRLHRGQAASQAKICVAVQRMVRSDLASAGVMFTLDTESGFRDVVLITSSFGLGSTVAQGVVSPDEFYVFKPTLPHAEQAIIRRTLGSKLQKMEFATSGVQTTATSVTQRNRFSLEDAQVLQLARIALQIEQHFGKPMDIEWAKDGLSGELYVLQARPETATSQPAAQAQTRYQLKSSGPLLVSGHAIGQKVGAGPVRFVESAAQLDSIRAGDILVTDMTDPNWEPVMKRVAAIVTNRGGRTCHAAILARELGIPAVVGCVDATQKLSDGMVVTVSCAQGDTGHIFEGLLDMQIAQVERGSMPALPAQVMMNVGNPQLAFDLAQLPGSGVGLARLEHIIHHNIGVHPKAILEYPHVEPDLKLAVESLARGYSSPRAFFVEKLAQGIATIAAAFYPKPVVVRLADFKSDEYKKLIGGSRYEPDEPNPGIGLRGAARYVSKDFTDCFRMECEALKQVRDAMALRNVEIMVPFVRTLQEAQGVVDLLASNGLVRGQDGLRLVMMCEVPSNALLATQFLTWFDGFVIGPQDLTQLTLGADRNSSLVANSFSPYDPAVLALLEMVVQACHQQQRSIAVCGSKRDIALLRWLLARGIDAISLDPQELLQVWTELAEPAQR